MMRMRTIRVQSGMSNGRGPARKRLVSAALFALLLTPACVVPPDIEAPPDEVQVGPMLVQGTIDPQGPEVKVGPSCLQAFTIGEITDGNKGDTLYYRWYVDYDAEDPVHTIYVASGKIAPPADASAVRHGPAYTLDATSQYLGDRTAKSVHTVEIIVADRPFEEDSTALPKFKVVSAGGVWTYYAWTVTLKTDCPTPGL
jgi:hypothetical protein